MPYADPEARRKYREANRVKLRAASAEWRARNRDKLAEYNREYCKRNRLRRSENNAAWRARNTEATRENNRRYRATLSLEDRAYELRRVARYIKAADQRTKATATVAGRWSRLEDATLSRLRGQGWTREQIALSLGRSLSSVSSRIYVLRKSGVSA